MNLLTTVFTIYVVLTIFPAIAQETTTEELQSMNTNSSLQEIIATLKETQELIKSQTTSIEESSIMSENFENVRTQTMIIAGIEASLIGALVALIGQNYVMRKMEHKKIEKTKNLILDDITRIYKNINQILLEIEILRSNLRTSQTIQLDIIHNGGQVRENIARILVNARLLHWNAIVSSGYLIKLDTDAIRSLQNLNNYLEETRSNSLQSYHLFTDNIVKFITASSPNPNLITDVTTQLNNIAEYFHLIYPKTIKKLYKIESDVKWIYLNENDIKKKLDVKK